MLLTFIAHKLAVRTTVKLLPELVLPIPQALGMKPAKHELCAQTSQYQCCTQILWEPLPFSMLCNAYLNTGADSVAVDMQQLMQLDATLAKEGTCVHSTMAEA